MDKIIVAVLRYSAYVAGIASGAWLGFPVALRVLLIVMLLDIVTGVVRAFLMKDLSVAVAFSGVGRKVITLIVIALVYGVAGMLDPSVGEPLLVAVIGYYCYVEVLSVITNAAAAGVPIPDFLKNALAGLSPDKLEKVAPTLPPVKPGDLPGAGGGNPE
jgi:toxin secretion/phage lysis holin